MRSSIDRAFTREYIDARVTGVLAWPAIISMPQAVLRHADRGLLTADQPWSGSYEVNAMTWAVAHITQFASPPTASNPGGWKYLNSASGYLQGRRANGSYVTLLRGTRDQWSTIIETTGGVTGIQRASFAVTGGKALAGRTVHVWSSNFSIGAGPAQWFVRGPDITPVNGKFALTIKPGHVYSLSTTSGQGKGTTAGPPAADLPLPYRNNLAAGKDEPAMLAAEDGSFELARCNGPGGVTTCTKQTTRGKPVLWVLQRVRIQRKDQRKIHPQAAERRHGGRHHRRGTSGQARQRRGAGGRPCPVRRAGVAHPVAVSVGPDHPGERRRTAGNRGDRRHADQRDTGDRGRRLVSGLLLPAAGNEAGHPDRVAGWQP